MSRPRTKPDQDYKNHESKHLTYGTVNYCTVHTHTNAHTIKRFFTVPYRTIPHQVPPETIRYRTKR